MPWLEAEAFSLFLRKEFEQLERDDPKSWAKPIAELARRANMRHTVIARWLSDDPALRVKPSPENLRRVADVLGIRHVTILAAAGYLPMTDEGPRPAHHEDARARGRRVRRWIDEIEPEFWPQLAPLVDAQLDGMRTTLERVLDIFREQRIREAERDDRRF